MLENQPTCLGNCTQSQELSSSLLHLKTPFWLDFCFPGFETGTKKSLNPSQVSKIELSGRAEAGTLRLCGGKGGGHLVSTLQSLMLHDLSSGTNWLVLLVCFRRTQFPNVFTQNSKLQPVFQGFQFIHRQRDSDSFTRGKYLEHSGFYKHTPSVCSPACRQLEFSLQLHLSTVFLCL